MPDNNGGAILDENDKRLIGTFHDQGLPHPQFDAPAPPPARWVNFRHEGWEAAGDDVDGDRAQRLVAGNRAWRQACEAARTLLSHGDGGQCVLRKEYWQEAIARVAGALLRAEHVGRPMGRVNETWIRIVHEVAGYGSAAFDGLVAHESGIRVTARSLSG
jgi:hypothetical protein